MTPEERRDDIAALRALGAREWAHVIRYHEKQLKEQEKRK